MGEAPAKDPHASVAQAPINATFPNVYDPLGSAQLAVLVLSTRAPNWRYASAAVSNACTLRLRLSDRRTNCASRCLRNAFSKRSSVDSNASADVVFAVGQYDPTPAEVSRPFSAYSADRQAWRRYAGSDELVRTALAASSIAAAPDFAPRALRLRS